MNPLLNLFSLVLACSTGFAMAALGFLPVAQLRQLGGEFLIAAGAWAVVALTARPAVFHWYLIIAIVCLIAWTKRERLGGKIGLAAAAAIGLSLGIIFPIQISPGLQVTETPFALASLYLGGLTSGLGYLLFVSARVQPPGSALKPAVWLLILTIGWGALLVTGCLSLWYPQVSLFLQYDPPPVGPTVQLYSPIVSALVVILLALSTLVTKRVRPAATRWLGLATALAAMLTNLITQVMVR
jgi:hypothetical protein